MRDRHAYAHDSAVARAVARPTKDVRVRDIARGSQQRSSVATEEFLSLQELANSMSRHPVLVLR